MTCFRIAVVDTYGCHRSRYSSILMSLYVSITVADVRFRPVVQGVCEKEEGRGGGRGAGAEAAGAGMVYSFCKYRTIVQ